MLYIPFKSKTTMMYSTLRKNKKCFEKKTKKLKNTKISKERTKNNFFSDHFNRNIFIILSNQIVIIEKISYIQI